MTFGGTKWKIGGQCKTFHICERRKALGTLPRFGNSNSWLWKITFQSPILLLFECRKNLTLEIKCQTVKFWFSKKKMKTDYTKFLFCLVLLFVFVLFLFILFFHQRTTVVPFCIQKCPVIIIYWCYLYTGVQVWHFHCTDLVKTQVLLLIYW